MTETYQVGVYCKNCDNELKPVNVPKGTRADEFLMEKTCGNCGVKGLLHGMHIPMYTPEYKVE